MAPPIGSGPYIVDAVDPGKSVTLKRNPNYWGRDLPVNRGLWNFDEVRLDFYRDGNSHFEAFKKGLYDVRAETDPGRWEEAYDFPAVRDGRVVKEGFANGLPKGMSGLVFNTRRPVFADIRVRQALLLLFDFEWINKNFFFDRYARTKSYFDGSELSSHGIAADARERALLAPFPGAVRSDILDGTWSPPVERWLRPRPRHAARSAATSSRGRLRTCPARNCARATPKSRSRSKSWSPPRIRNASRCTSPNNLKRAGIAANVRVVDAVQYDRRRLTFDFDMIQNRWDQSLSPGNEQAFYWSTRRRCRGRHAQLHGRQESRRRRDDRGAAARRKPRRLRRRRARARSRAAVGILRDPAVSCCRSNGWRAGPRSGTRTGRHSRATCRKPGGGRPGNSRIHDFLMSSLTAR